jgi:hypothetical protein
VQVWDCEQRAIIKLQDYQFQNYASRRARTNVEQHARRSRRITQKET